MDLFGNGFCVLCPHLFFRYIIHNTNIATALFTNSKLLDNQRISPISRFPSSELGGGGVRSFSNHSSLSKTPNAQAKKSSFLDRRRMFRQKSRLSAAPKRWRPCQLHYLPSLRCCRFSIYESDMCQEVSSKRVWRPIAILGTGGQSASRVTAGVPLRRHHFIYFHGTERRRCLVPDRGTFCPTGTSSTSIFRTPAAHSRRDTGVVILACPRILTERSGFPTKLEVSTDVKIDRSSSKR